MCSKKIIANISGKIAEIIFIKLILLLGRIH